MWQSSRAVRMPSGFKVALILMGSIAVGAALVLAAGLVLGWQALSGEARGGSVLLVAVAGIGGVMLFLIGVMNPSNPRNANRSQRDPQSRRE